MYLQTVLVFTAVIVLHVLECSAVPSLLKPQILLNGTEDIVDANTNYSAFCQGQKPLVWKTPQVDDEEYKQWTTFKTEEETPTSTNFKFGIRLYITNMTYKFVGFYCCHYEENENDKAEMYLYVEDEHHLSLISKKNFVQHVYVRMYDTVIIPCRPTSPTVNVTISGVDDDMDTNSMRYNPFYGFLTNATTVVKRELLICDFTRNGQHSQNYYNFIVEPFSTYIDQPEIIDANSGHTVSGETIKLTCEIHSELSVEFTWDIPNKHSDKRRIHNISGDEYDKNYQYSILNIFGATSADEGFYTCHVFDHQNHTNVSHLAVKIFDHGESEISLERLNCSEYQQTYAGKDSIVCTVNVWGHPTPTYTWSEFTIVVFKLFINMSSINKPYVSVKMDKAFHRPDELGKVFCTATGYPVPVIQWEFQTCSKKKCSSEKRQGLLLDSQGLTSKSVITVSSNNLVSVVRCTATNFNGSDEDSLDFVISEFDNGFDITEFEDTVVLNKERSSATIAVGEAIRFLCGASKYKYTNLTFFFGNAELKSDERFHISHSTTKFSHKAYLEIKKARPEDAGTYGCRVNSVNSTENYEYKKITVFVKVPVKPSLTDPKSEVIETNFPKDVKMACQVSGIPKPKITWYKNDIDIKAEGARIIIDDENQTLRFNTTREDDAAEYKCMAKNKIGVVFKHWSLRFKNSQKTSVWLYIVIIILFIICIVAVAVIYIRTQKERIGSESETETELQDGCSVDSEKTDMTSGVLWMSSSGDSGLSKQLGSGAFGVVMKGEAKHIIEGEPVTVVAVKMVKKNADRTHIKALASELKIMVHLGKHLNVVNLLGACTKNVIKEELLVIVEYCRYGNLLNYLLRHRSHFVNQVDPLTKKVNYNIGQEILDRTYSVSSSKSIPHSPSLKYAALGFSNRDNSSREPLPDNMNDYRAEACSDGMFKTDTTAVTQVSDDGLILSNNSAQPEWRSNYTGDYKENGRPMSTKDLIAWSFQVARGMEYLSSRKVLHGDLAARNILLADDNVVKICDFGLAKSMYRSDVYVKRGNCPLPIKWMAIESLRDHVFSVQSDVWSFGIVLWEFFSLGRTPYSGIEAENLHPKLLDGYRMESPEFAPTDIYHIMTECWAANPLSRPSFTKLSDRIGAILEDSMRKHYIDLNDPYLAMNTKRVEEGQSDYLAMLSPPTFEALSSPLCVDDIASQQSADEGYMSMKPTSIFSPRVTDGNVFDFNMHNRKHSNSNETSGHELVPMLHASIESDCETPLQSPNSVSNPSYHHMPTTILEENLDEDKDIVKSVDNYVDMLQNKTMMKEKCTGAPIKIEPAYVNAYSRDWDSFGVQKL
nr:vascular endothelial growth factor receptor 1-like [Leptinotarsa decemlineata]